MPHATACGKARSGVTLLCSCRLLPLSLQAGRVVGGGGGGEVAEAGPTETLDPMPGVPQEEVAGGGVGLGRSGWVGRRREVGPGLSILRNRQDGRTRNRWCIPKVAPTRGVHWLYVTEPPPKGGMGWDGMGWGPVGGSPWYLLSFVIVFPSVQIGPLPALLSRPRGPRRRKQRSAPWSQEIGITIIKGWQKVLNR